MKAIAIALALGASAVLAIPALAAEPEVRTTHVKVTDEDFASSQSLARLESQIRRAARKVCVRPDNSRAPSLDEQLCIARALAGARQELAAVQARHNIAMGG